MKKTLAGLGVLALVALGATGVSFPATAASVQPVAEIVTVPDAIIASPDAVLVQPEPAVGTVAAPVERVAPVVAPKAPKAPKARVAAPKAPVVVPAAPAPAPAVDPYSGNPIVDCAAQGLVRVEDYSCVPLSFNAPEAGTDAPFVFPACDEEDDTVTSKGVAVDSCYWDAQERGNGTGQSFT